MPMLKDEAVCIRLMEWSETSQIAVLLTEHHGKIAATAKGAKRRNPSTLERFSGGVELLSRAEAVFIVKASAELANLIEYDLIDAHWHLRRSVDAFRLAMYAADLLHHLVQDTAPHPRSYRALRQFLVDLVDRDRGQAALLRFQWEVIDDMGYRPVLDRDAETGEPLDAAAATVAFSPAAGGVVTDTGAGDRWRVRRQTLEALRRFGSAHNGSPAPAGPTSEEHQQALGRANRLLCVYVRYLLDKELPTMRTILEPGD